MPDNLANPGAGLVSRLVEGCLSTAFRLSKNPILIRFAKLKNGFKVPACSSFGVKMKKKGVRLRLSFFSPTQIRSFVGSFSFTFVDMKTACQGSIPLLHFYPTSGCANTLTVTFTARD